MNKKQETGLLKSARVLFYIISVLSIIAGLNYVLRGDLMPYHYDYLGKSKAEIDTRTLTLLISAARLIGSMMISLGATFALLTWNMGKTGSGLLTVMTVLAIPPLAVSFYVVVSIGELIPQALVGALILFFISGLLILCKNNKK